MDNDDGGGVGRGILANNLIIKYIDEMTHSFSGTAKKCSIT